MTTTPGPWKFYDSYSYNGVVWFNRLGSDTDTVLRSSGGMDIGVSMSDASLLAAAPDLLKAAIRLEQAQSGLDWCDEDERAQRWADLRAAIAKAKGEA